MYQNTPFNLQNYIEIEGWTQGKLITQKLVGYSNNLVLIYRMIVTTGLATKNTLTYLIHYDDAVQIKYTVPGTQDVMNFVCVVVPLIYAANCEFRQGGEES